MSAGLSVASDAGSTGSDPVADERGVAGASPKTLGEGRNGEVEMVTAESPSALYVARSSASASQGEWKRAMERGNASGRLPSRSLRSRHRAGERTWFVLLTQNDRSGSPLQVIYRAVANLDGKGARNSIFRRAALSELARPKVIRLDALEPVQKRRRLGLDRRRRRLFRHAG